jgi:HPt (histidine-containing phosphotransfer) domain-containing protein
MISIVNQQIQAELTEMMGEDDWKELLSEAATQFAERAQVLNEAIAQEDWAKVRSMAHKIKGSMGSLGYDAIFKVLDALEAQLLSQPPQLPTADELQKIRNILTETALALPAV